MGFSMNMAVPGSALDSWISRSRPFSRRPRNAGGEPTQTAWGRLSSLRFARYDCRSGYTSVSLYAGVTNELFLKCSVCLLRSELGSTRAVTLRRGPSLCSRRNEWFQGPSSEPNMMLPAPTMSTRKSSPGAGGFCLYMAVSRFRSNSVE